MSEQMDFNDGKYTVIHDDSGFRALRYGGPWRNLNGDHLVYSMLVEAIRLKEERDALAAKLKELERQEPAYFVDEQGFPRKYTSRDFNQCNYGGLKPLYARPVPAEPHHKHAAPWLGWALHIIRERCPDVVTSHQFERAEDAKKACFAEGLDQAPAEPVNARLLEALEELVAEFVVCGLTEKARAAIAAAESAPKAVRLTDEEINVAYFDAMKQHVRPQDANEVRRVVRRAETAVLRKNGLEVSK